MIYKMRGSLLLEGILSIWVLWICMSLLGTYLQVIQKTSEPVHKMNGEWELFIQQLSSEIVTGKYSSIYGGHVILFQTMENKQIRYEKYGQVIRRRVNNQGNEWVLLNVLSFSATFKPIERNLEIKVDFLDGTKQKEVIYFQT